MCPQRTAELVRHRGLGSHEGMHALTSLQVQLRRVIYRKAPREDCTRPP